MSTATFGPPRNFELDDFQIVATEHVEAGRSVVVAAPTGSGKTYVAEYAIARAKAAGKRSIYTTPIKALSNQKFRDLRSWLGMDNVGLLTGDNSINGESAAVVMTTEVLRNMLYSEPERLDGTGLVVMDEVHYLQNTFRGPVWEEVIINLPSHIRIVALSATVSNAEELSAWISEVHAPCVAVTESTRPVRLESSLVVGEKGSSRQHIVPLLRKGRPNPEGRRFDVADDGRRGRDRRRGPRTKQPYRTPRRSEIIEELDRRGLLPAISFIFSRAGCEDAVGQLRSAGVHLTDPDTEASIVEYVEQRTAHLSDADRRALQYSTWLRGLRSGLAAHHAGIVPLFKETVEELFTRGWLKAVFATETLALGINMPARTVVIEKLTKFTGEHHELLTPGDYTQLTGRAGRRGIDDQGHAFVLWTPFTGFDDVSALARSNSFELKSAFRPTYNMTCHLVNGYTRKQAEELITKSFGQFQTNAAVGELEARRERLVNELAKAGGSPAHGGGADRALEPERLREISDAIGRLKPGDVLNIDGPEGQRVAVLSSTWRRKVVRLRVVDAFGQVHELDPEAFEAAPAKLGEVRLPEPFNPNSRSHQHDIVAQLGASTRRSKSKKSKRAQRERAQANQSSARFAGTAANELSRDLARVEARIAERKGRLNGRFRSVVGLLSELKYIENWALTDRGSMLLGTFHELDLVIVESLRAGHLDGHDPATLAGLVSLFVYEQRGSDEPSEPWFSNAEAEAAANGILASSREVQRLESRYGLPESRDVDAGLFAATYGWASGGGLGDILGTESLTGGDFVRSMRQVIDILAQLAIVSNDVDTSRSARQARGKIERGIVDAHFDDPEGQDAPENAESDA